MLITSQLSNRLKHGDVHESADLETEERRKSGIIYSYTCSRIIFHYHSIISTTLNLNNDWSHVMYPQPTNVQAKALKNHIDVCMQIVRSQALATSRFCRALCHAVAFLKRLD